MIDIITIKDKIGIIYLIYKDIYIYDKLETNDFNISINDKKNNFLSINISNTCFHYYYTLYGITNDIYYNLYEKSDLDLYKLYISSFKSYYNHLYYIQGSYPLCIVYNNDRNKPLFSIKSINNSILANINNKKSINIINDNIYNRSLILNNKKYVFSFISLKYYFYSYITWYKNFISFD